MIKYELFVAYVSWPGGGKVRPILFLKKTSRSTIYAFKITTKFEEKTNNIKKLYYEIKDWKLAGLNRKSYIDTVKVYNIPLKEVSLNRIGKLGSVDIHGLKEFTKGRFNIL